MMPSRTDVMDQLTRVSVCHEILNTNGIALVHNCDDLELAQEMATGYQAVNNAYRKYTDVLEKVWKKA